MPLYILLILVVGGISLVALLLHRLGKSHLTVLTGQSARAAWERHFPDDQVLGVEVAENGHAALIETNHGLGLLWSFGADTVGRYLQNHQLSDTPKQMTIKFADFAAPRVALTLSDAERPHWQQKLAPT